MHLSNEEGSIAGKISYNFKGGEKMGKKGKMTSEAARRIQSHADKTGRNQDFKQRAQRAAAKNKE